MIEIAISLAVIGFALVAIIGILPTGMNVQKENREETIIGQEAGLFMEAIRSGARGMDDLTNYVDAITNYQAAYGPNGSLLGRPVVFGYTYSNSSPINNFPLTNGFRIVGLLSAPKYLPGPNQAIRFLSNYTVAYVRSMSGPAGEKVPQNNPAIRELVFSYRLSSDVVPYASYDPKWTNFTDISLYVPTTNFAEIVLRSNYWRLARNVQTNLYDLRLTFRWPLLANGNVGNGRQVFRTLVGGSLLATNDFGFPTYPLYFFEPRNYVKAP